MRGSQVTIWGREVRARTTVILLGDEKLFDGLKNSLAIGFAKCDPGNHTPQPLADTASPGAKPPGED
ncbi:MAG: hypothetical protein C7B47_13460 [Sulfobacillus thermosulfidooxidans]|uniref:Uncharacterized protein n=1 Tax=Sulfobacillus thermosulfidooxidans TaxID=28034 RepID=A0A2T2WRZ8_SULTH|nr:MAG: hypothetical protein C7B47_13460 [Sulfobacillus thermosulfidooxidans]